MCACIHAILQGEMWDMLCVCLGHLEHARLWGRQLLLPWCISWHMQAMNYQATRVNYPKERKKKNETETLAPVAPGSLFQFRDWFSQNVEGKRREEKQPWRSEGGMMRSWGRKKRKGMKPPYMCVSSPFLPLSPSWSNPESKAQCENAKCYYQAFRVHKCHLWWMSVGFRKASCPTPAVSPP